MTRAMLATVLHRLDGSPDIQHNAAFDDIAADTWYSNGVAWAAQQGITTGVSSSLFAPDSAVTREALVTMLYRYAQKSSLTLDGTQSGFTKFDDAASVSDWAEEAMNWACSNGIIEGSNNLLRPGAVASRSEVSAVLMRFAAAATQAKR